MYTRPLIYLLVFATMLAMMFVVPVPGGYVWEPWFINGALSLLFTLFVWLSARLARTDGTPLGIVATGVFVLLFCPGADKFFQRDEGGLLELASQCIVPFFMGQFQRIRRKDFRKLYALMLLMGVFCSYTHNGITIPMCAAFAIVALRTGRAFFRRACWPMVVGVGIGTGLSVWRHWGEGLALAADLTHATTALSTLWDTKVFVLSLGLTAYLCSWHGGRRLLLYATRRHFVLSLCAMTSLLILPFAPLGLENAVAGVCFFHMFWLLFMCRYLIERYTGYK